jgi:nucleoside-triphosphatase
VTPAHILIEARPGAGKTTALRRLSDLLLEAGVPLGGFLTEEMRQAGRRVGFELVTFLGERSTLAHVELPGPPRVGRYGVDLAGFERLALPALDDPPADGVVLIDALGKMELASERFRAAVDALLDRPLPVVATVHVARHPFTDALKRRTGVETLRLAAANRARIPDQLFERLEIARAPGLGPRASR